jgi:uncharacterized membrane protein
MFIVFQSIQSYLFLNFSVPQNTVGYHKTNNILYQMKYKKKSLYQSVRKYIVHKALLSYIFISALSYYQTIR